MPNINIPVIRKVIFIFIVLIAVASVILYFTLPEWKAFFVACCGGVLIVNLLMMLFFFKRNERK